MSVPLLLSQLFPYTTLFRSAFLERRFRHREDRAALFDAEVVVREPARWPLFALVIGRQVGADDLPTLPAVGRDMQIRSEEHTSELQSLRHLVCRLLLEKKHM